MSLFFHLPSKHLSAIHSFTLARLVVRWFPLASLSSNCSVNIIFSYPSFFFMRTRITNCLILMLSVCVLFVAIISRTLSLIPCSSHAIFSILCFKCVLHLWRDCKLLLRFFSFFSLITIYCYRSRNCLVLALRYVRILYDKIARIFSHVSTCVTIWLQLTTHGQ